MIYAKLDSDDVEAPFGLSRFTARAKKKRTIVFFRLGCEFPVPDDSSVQNTVELETMQRDFIFVAIVLVCSVLQLEE